MIGRMLLITGLVMAAVGVILILGERLPVKFGRLPGDIVWRGKNTTFYFPVMTIILLNLAIALVLWLFRR